MKEAEAIRNGKKIRNCKDSVRPQFRAVSSSVPAGTYLTGRKKTMSSDTKENNLVFAWLLYQRL